MSNSTRIFFRTTRILNYLANDFQKHIYENTIIKRGARFVENIIVSCFDLVVAGTRVAMVYIHISCFQFLNKCDFARARALAEPSGNRTNQKTRLYNASRKPAVGGRWTCGMGTAAA